MALKLPKLGIPRLKDLKKATETETIDIRSLNVNEQNAFNQALLAWKAPRYINKKRPKSWYVIATLITLGLIAYGLLTNAWTFSVAIVLFVGVYYYFASQEVPVVQIIISKMGIRVGTKVYPYSMFRTFWVDYSPPNIVDLHFVPNNSYKYELTIHFHGQDPAKIKQVLQEYLPEWVDRRKTITESLVHLIGL